MGKAKAGVAMAALALLGGCAWYDGRGLQPGASTGEDVRASMGSPVAVYREADTEIWEYDRGFERYMARVGPGGKLAGIDQVFTSANFSRTQPGMSPESVRRMYGTPYRETRFDRRNETVWDYRFYDSIFDYVTYFHVVFDDASSRVKTTLYTRDYRVSGSDGDIGK